MTGIDETFNYLPITEGRTRGGNVHLFVRSFPTSHFFVTLCGRDVHSNNVSTYDSYKAKRCAPCIAVAGALGSNMIPMRRV